MFTLTLNIFIVFTSTEFVLTHELSCRHYSDRRSVQHFVLLTNRCKCLSMHPYSAKQVDYKIDCIYY